jgi:DNA modification methylase
MKTRSGVEIHMPDRVVMRRIDELIAYARNARTHDEEQVAELARSMERFKTFTNPVLTADDGILAGHGRVLAAGLLGLQVVPTIDLSHLNDTERRAYILADNKLALNAGWDIEVLKVELVDLQTAGFDLSLTGFRQEELDELFPAAGEQPEKDPDQVPEVPEVPHTAAGDVWILGPHRVMCGSSLNLPDWDKLMAGEKADMCWTDPPYNVDIGAKNAGLDRADGGKRAAKGGIANDAMSDAKFLDFLCDLFRSIYEQMKPGAAIYVAHPDREGHNFHNAFRMAGFKFSGCVVWRKNQMVLGMTDYQNIHEPLLYGWKPGKAHRWFGGRKQVTVSDMGEGSPFTRQPDGSYTVQIGDEILVVSGEAQVQTLTGSVVFHDKPGRAEKHPTTKPVGLVQRQLVNNARRNDVIIDACTGSGSTLIAAEICGMVFRGMELDPRFCDVICQRYFEYTGRVPINENTGEPFPVVRES